MRHILFAAIFFASILLAACGNKAADLYDTAQFEEVQSNRDHAIKLYEEIERKYPGTEQAKKAQERLKMLKAEKK